MAVSSLRDRRILVVEDEYLRQAAGFDIELLGGPSPSPSATSSKASAQLS